MELGLLMHPISRPCSRSSCQGSGRVGSVRVDFTQLMHHLPTICNFHDSRGVCFMGPNMIFLVLMDVHLASIQLGGDKLRVHRRLLVAGEEAVVQTHLRTALELKLLNMGSGSAALAAAQ